MKTLRRLKATFDCSVVQKSFEYRIAEVLPALILGGQSRTQRDIVRANYLALSQNLDRAGQILAATIARDPSSKSAAISLGSYVSQMGWTNHHFAWERIRHLWKDIDHPRKLTSTNFAFYALGAELALLNEPEIAMKSINDVYLAFIWKYQRCDKKDHSPILYWHIPKTGGTSVNTKLSKVWYSSGTEFLPSYTTRSFFSYVLRHHNGALPYISSAHLPADCIDYQVAKQYRKLLVLRDPEQRALSAWRQYRENPSRRMIILPQHGFVWDFFPIRNFSDWLQSAPVAVVNPLSWTLSDFAVNGYGDAVDDIVPIANLDDYGNELLRSLGVDVKEKNFRVGKNVTNKSVKQGAINFELPKKFLSPDYKVFDELTEKRYR
jgi:hypothetical protein